MARLPHGASITLEALREAQEKLVNRSADIPLAFVAAVPGDTHDFDFLFPELQNDPTNLLPEAGETIDNLIRLGRTMRDASGGAAAGDSDIPAAYTYFGQFVDHDITLEAVSADLPNLLSPDLVPLPVEEIKDKIRNTRTGTLDLDSIYGLPAFRVAAKMEIGKVTPLNGTSKPTLRPPGKGDANDLKREPRGTDPEHDRAALIGDPRNDENLIIAQLHLAFLLTHNVLVDKFEKFRKARRLLRQHYQHIVLQDFLKRIADPQIVDDTIKKNRVYDAMGEPFFMPLEFSVAAYRFGHSMVRAVYDFNLNFNTSSQIGTIPATLQLLFTFTALSGELGGFDTLPDNWIIEWQNVVDVGGPFNKARLIDTKLVEPLFELRDLQGNVLPGDGGRLAVRNLLRGYLLRLPTGQAVGRVLSEKLQGIREMPVLTPDQIAEGAASEEQVQVLQDAGFLERTPLWYYILAEAAVLAQGKHLGPVGSTIVAEVLVGLVRRSQNSILRTKKWKPTLTSDEPGKFTLTDLLKFAGVL
jgi:Animal haem peroxidase